MGVSERGRGTAESREGAVAALSGVAGLVLPRADWAHVERALGAMEAAVRAGDARALGVATGQLELVGPSRVRLRAGEEGDGREPAPPEVLDRLNRLVHALRSGADDDDLDLTEGAPAGGDPH
ncbi:CATRA system-associated protein [Streptomyces sp. NPDC007983]|uniref:CATRA system-associated protein n=1 Tax=Streptomyces sp. NPDC007983 TaxID=3364800 RepID=UPI0036E4322E